MVRSSYQTGIITEGSMKLEKEDYIDPRCALCGRQGEEESAQPVPIGRIMEKLR